MKVKKTYRVEEELHYELVRFAEEHGVTVTDAVEDAIRRLTEDARRVPDACQTPEEPSSGTDSAIAALVSQLEVKDRQIADLSAALVSAQKSVEQAHYIHATDQQDKLLESSERKEERKGFWARLFGGE